MPGTGGSNCTIGPSPYGGGAWLTPPAVPTALEAPAGATVVAHFQGIGVQVYTCAASGNADAGSDGGATTYSWVLKTPDARLYDAACEQKGIHTQGPTWTSTVDGSAVVGTKTAQADSPLADAIPWLLLRAASNSGTGVFSSVTYIQRLNTTKGRAPATGCDSTTTGAETRIDYAADYYFYQGGALAADAGTDATPG